MHLNILVFFAFILLGCVLLGLILWWGNYQEVKKSEESKNQIKLRDDREILHKCQEERARTTRLIHMGTPEFRIEKGKPEKKVSQAQRKTSGIKEVSFLSSNANTARKRTNGLLKEK